jgi:hypothetical protein
MPEIPPSVPLALMVEQIAQRLPDNTTGQITPADLRHVLFLILAALRDGVDQ